MRGTALSVLWMITLWQSYNFYSHFKILYEEKGYRESVAAQDHTTNKKQASYSHPGFPDPKLHTYTLYYIFQPLSSDKFK